MNQLLSFFASETSRTPSENCTRACTRAVFETSERKFSRSCLAKEFEGKIFMDNVESPSLHNVTFYFFLGILEGLSSEQINGLVSIC